ncbi:class I SAM-dependent DNA methyltransferase [Nocardiopsis kunsanensis]|uniref:Methyltransferase n=1 Tax=Nocardiopsis kunsanensis TaxID=141693 RepID=A0A918X5S7_9ACTN|nr:class I SAM-dependent methyltransferase [Nocardiopsis kunsanensis]GHD14303.1 methyltransferase [Nocardiopsis kunsanensis]
MTTDHSGPPPSPGTEAWAERSRSQAEAFDIIGERYDEAFPHKEGQEQHTRRLIELLPAGSHVLDLGSGTGLPTARQLVRAGARVRGHEISPHMIELARTHVPEAEFVRADIMDLDPDERRYDAVVAFFSLLCLPRAQIPTALGLIRAALVPGGVLCLSMVEAEADDVPIPFVGARVRVTGYGRAELRTVVEEAGLVVEDERVVSYEPGEGAPPETQVFLTCRRSA